MTSEHPAPMTKVSQSKSSLQRKLSAAIAVALVSIVGLGILQYRTARRLSDDSRWVSHSHIVLREFSESRNNINRADASAQSFLITGDITYGASFAQAITSLRQHLQSLRNLTADNTTQQHNLDSLEPLVADSTRALQEEISSRKAGQLTEGQAQVLESSVRKSINDVRVALTNMEAVELGLLEHRNETEQQANRRAYLFIFLGSLIAVAFLVAFALALRRDIAERTRSEGKFRQLLESAPDAMVIVNRQGRIVLTNAQTSALFGYEREELLGQPVEMLMPERYRKQHGGHRALYFHAPHPRAMGANLELHGLKKDGEEFPIEISLSPMETQEEILVSSAIRDITERKAAESRLRAISGRLLQVQENERRHIGRELHDSLGQYLAALKMGLDSLRNNAAVAGDRAQQKLAECSDLADHSMREVRTASYLLYPPMLDELGLQSAIPAYLEGFTKRSGIQATFEIPPNLGRMHPDTELVLFRVLQESLTNVHRHSGSSTTHVRIVREDGVVRLEVEDAGRGMPAEKLANLQQGSADGLGVGLRGMNERMQHFQGRLEVSSTPQGTTVRVTVPAANSSSATDA